MAKQIRIFCTFQKEGYHRWVNAPENVEYLTNVHRHMFHFKVEIPVTHSDRQIEFITFKQDCSTAIDKIFAEDTKKTGSCELYAEQLGTLIMQYYKVDSIKVECAEDGENGAVVILNNSIKK